MLLVVAIVLAFLVLPAPWGVVAVAVAAVIEAAEIWFWWWLSRRRKPTVGIETMTGAPATAVTALRPDGQVRVRGELWQARCAAGADVGAAVRVVGVEGLTLVVEPADGISPR
jgi:membrane-bound ClpP family serine protease